MLNGDNRWQKHARMHVCMPLLRSLYIGMYIEEKQILKLGFCRTRDMVRPSTALTRLQKMWVRSWYHPANDHLELSSKGFD